MKQLRTHIFMTIAILTMYILLAFWFERTATRQHERDFNTQQARQTQLSAQSIEDHYEWVQGEIASLAGYTLPHYIVAGYSPHSMVAMFGARAQIVFPDEELIIGYFTQPDTPFAIYRHPDTPAAADSLLNDWLNLYWAQAETNLTPWVTPFTITLEHQFYGLMLPVFALTDEAQTDTFQGVLIAVLDFAPVLDRYIIPMRSGKYGAAWVQDDAGLVIYDHEPETVGDSVFDISQPYPDLRRVVNRMVTEETGLDTYHYTLELGGTVERKLVAWSTAYIGDQRLTVALSAPDSEINAAMALMRGQLIALGSLLALALVVSSSLVYWNRQRSLTRLVTERTQQLAHLTNQLEQRVAERTQELEHERAQLKTIIEAMTDGVIFRRGWDIAYVNKRLCDMLGYSSEELLTDPQTVFKTMSSLIDWTQLVSTHHELKGTWRAEGQLKRKDGSVFDASIYIAEVRKPDDQPFGIIEIIRDISREKALYRQRDSFITNAAHEFRNPLANLKTRLYLLKRQPERLHEHLEIVEHAANHMAELIQDLIDMAQFNKGDIKLNRRALELTHILRAALSIQAQHAYQIRVSMTESLPDHPIHIYADHQRLMQTFNNLIANAIQSTGPDGRVEISVSLLNDSEWVSIQIHDNGPALSQDQLALVFEPFARPSVGSIRRTGMDLALSRHIIEEHGGTIAVASHPTLGTTFTIQLPRHRSEPSESN